MMSKILAGYRNWEIPKDTKQHVRGDTRESDGFQKIITR